MEKFWMISLGAILGANTRYWIGTWAAEKFGSAFPYGTMIINLTGSFFIGFFLTLATERLALDPRWRYLVVVGFLGAYTTFSTFTFESFKLIDQGQWLLAFLNVLGSTVLGIILIGLGVFAAKMI
jgi:fluoride exporter